jgi:membrane peptidoglycan carboxypeptidase
MIFAPFLLAQGLENGLLSLGDAAVSLKARVQVGSDQIGCAVEPAALLSETGPVLADALRNGCPGPLISIATRNGSELVQAAVTGFALTEMPLSELGPAGLTESAALLSPRDSEMDAIGQGEWGVSPLQVARAVATLRSGGTLAEVRLVDALQTPEGEWLRVASSPGHAGAVTPSTAALILEALKRDGYYGMGASAVTGAGGRRLSWFAGATPGGQPGVVVVVALEDGTLGDAWRIGSAAILALEP